MTDPHDDAARVSTLRPVRGAMLLVFGLLMPLSMGVRKCEDVPQNPDEPAAGTAGPATGGAGTGGAGTGGAGTGAAGTGGAGATCGGLKGVKCATGQYCKFAPDARCGAANQTGTCSTIPQICTLEYSPVCGCDDKTYGNACGAASAGTSVLRTGECEGGEAGKGSPEAGSGGKAGRGGDGGKAGKGGSGDAAGKGGAAAGSGGAAAGSGGAAAGSGGAPSAGRCGTRGGVNCGDAEFCNFEPDKDCGGTDKGGVCEAKGDICPDIYAPVCGCDNRTYPSDCNAHREGVSVKSADLCGPDECTAAGGHIVTSDGASTPMCEGNEESWSIRGGREATLCCRARPSAGKTCGGIAALMCAKDQFCNYEKSAGGQGCDGTIADAGGICQATPQACTKEYKPVCGCDHRTFGNACEAHSAGASVLHDGACTESDCKAIGGRVAFGTGPGPMCNSNETEFTSVTGDNGQMPIEGALCCMPK